MYTTQLSNTGMNSLRQTQNHKENEHAVILTLLEESIQKRNHITKILSNVTDQTLLNNDRVGQIYNKAFKVIKNFSCGHKNRFHDTNTSLKQFDTIDFTQTPKKVIKTNNIAINIIDLKKRKDRYSKNLSVFNDINYIKASKMRRNRDLRSIVDRNHTIAQHLTNENDMSCLNNTHDKIDPNKSRASQNPITDSPKQNTDRKIHPLNLDQLSKKYLGLLNHMPMTSEEKLTRIYKHININNKDKRKNNLSISVNSKLSSSDKLSDIVDDSVSYKSSKNRTKEDFFIDMDTVKDKSCADSIGNHVARTSPGTNHHDHNNMIYQLKNDDINFSPNSSSKKKQHSPKRHSPKYIYKTEHRQQVFVGIPDISYKQKDALNNSKSSSNNFGSRASSIDKQDFQEDEVVDTLESDDCFDLQERELFPKLIRNAHENRQSNITFNRINTKDGTQRNNRRMTRARDGMSKSKDRKKKIN